MGFAEEFIQGVMAGHNLQKSKQQEKWSEEDRGIEKDMLQHRLRELKIQEKLQARTASRENLNTMQGSPLANFPLSMLESLSGQQQAQFAEGVPAGVDTQVPSQQPAPMTIPGIEELGVPEISTRPQTMEQVMAAAAVQERMKALNTPQRVGEGQVVKLPSTGETLAQGPPRTFAPRAPGALVAITERDAKGKETTRWVTPEEAKTTTATKERIPQRPSSTTVIQMPASDLDANVESFLTGRFSPDYIQSFGVKDRGPILSRLSKAKFDLKTADLDMRATRAHMAAMNSTDIANRRIAAENATAALDELDAINKEAGSGGAGGSIWNSVARAMMLTTPAGKDLAERANTALGQARLAFAAISGGGDAVTNRMLDEAVKTMDGGNAAGITRMITSIRPHIRYRVNSILNLDPILSGGGSGAGGGSGTGGGSGVNAPGAVKPPTASDVAAALKAQGRASDPATVERVMANPQAMGLLFPVK